MLFLVPNGIQMTANTKQKMEESERHRDLV